MDVITPTIPWHNLLESLYPQDSLKIGWDLALVGVGIPTSLALGILNPSGIEAGHQAPEFYDTLLNGVVTGMIPSADQAWFEEHGPDIFLKKIKIPTLISQGTVDTLFDLTQGHRNFVALLKNEIPLKMMRFCGGHGLCNVDSDGAGGAIAGSPHVAERQLQWFDRYLKGNRKTRTGPTFEWIDQNAEWHGSPGGYPLKNAGHLKGFERRRDHPSHTRHQSNVGRAHPREPRPRRADHPGLRAGRRRGDRRRADAALQVLRARRHDDAR